MLIPPVILVGAVVTVVLIGNSEDNQSLVRVTAL